MGIRPGERVGAFEVLGPLGTGGMGEVYRARDPRLGREVALKVLPRSVSQDAPRLARFDREARFLAALNHPGIGAIYGIEESEDGPLLVLELVSGETLSDRLPGHALPLTEALTVCRQIADAVAYAHAKGVIHRDLKPANVKRTPEGHVKVLDFGLAKALASEPGAGMKAPTITEGETREGSARCPLLFPVRGSARDPAKLATPVPSPPGFTHPPSGVVALPSRSRRADAGSNRL